MRAWIDTDYAKGLEFTKEQIEAAQKREDKFLGEYNGVSVFLYGNNYPA